MVSGETVKVVVMDRMVKVVTVMKGAIAEVEVMIRGIVSAVVVVTRVVKEVVVRTGVAAEVVVMITGGSSSGDD